MNKRRALGQKIRFKAEDSGKKSKNKDSDSDFIAIQYINEILK